MDLLTMIAWLLAIGSLLAFFRLVVRAFTKSAGWGLAVLLLSPLTAAQFGLKFWDSEKKAFLLYLTTTFAAVGLGLYLFSSWGGWELLRTSSQVRRGIETRQLTALDAETFIKASEIFTDKSGLDISDPRIMAAARELVDRQQSQQATDQVEPEAEEKKDTTRETPINRKVASVPAERTRLVYQTIPLAEAHKYIGATAKVTRHNVEEKEYRLSGVTSKSLQFTQRNSSGVYSFALRITDIEKLRVLIKEPY
jgi:hypothetical protein